MQIWIMALLGALPFLATGGDQDLMDRFRQLPEKEQQLFIEQIETTLGELELPLVSLVQNLLEHREAPKSPPPCLEAKSWFNEKKYAPSYPIKRKVLPEKDPLMVKGREKFLKAKGWYDLRADYRYLLGKNKIFQLNKKRMPQDRLQQYLLGYPPHSDLAREILLKILDSKSTWDQHADYFDHTYTDREGNVYPGITLFDVWNCGHELECPDVDVIPFAWEILGDKSWKSPIPAGQRRTNLYRDIGVSFRDFRRYRLMVEGVASCFFASDPPLSPLMKPVKDEIHFLIARSEAEPQEVALFLDANDGYLELNRSIGILCKEYGYKFTHVILERKRSLDADHQKIREVALQELKSLLEGDE